MSGVSVIKLAEGVDDPVHAAKLRETFTRKLLEDESLRGDHADNLAEAVDFLEERFPEIAGLAIGEAGDFARRREVGKPKPAEPAPSSSKRNTPRARKKSAAPASKLAKAGHRGARGARGRAGEGGGGSSRLGRYGRQAWRDTGIPGAASNTTSAVLSIFGLTVGASLLYLLLTNAESSGPGRSAVAQIAGGTARAVESLILPVDPLRSASSARTGETAAPARPQDPTSASLPPRPRRERHNPPFPAERRPA